MSQLFSERFRSARRLNGYSLQDLSDQLENKISRQALHKYEKGEVIPDSEKIGLLCQALNVRPDYFFRENTVELGPIEFRKLQRFPAKEETRIIEIVRDKLARYLELEEILAQPYVFEHPLKDFGPVNEFSDIEKAADQVRIAWKLGCDPIANCIELLEDNGIKVIEVESEDSFDGMQTWVNGNIPVVAINTKRIKAADRKRFTVLHELGHLLLTFKDGIPEKEKEKFCHQFAGALLLPGRSLRVELGKSRSKLMIQELGMLKKEYGISIQAIVMRARDLEIVSESYTTQFFFYMRQMGWRVQEPFEYESEEKSKRFEQLLFRALAEEFISWSKAASLNNQTLAEFREKTALLA
jgi:Zn-dependent peptidase ImmA (M78 family)/transcriptional regulator with XRE-family HTH domain